MAAAFSWTGCFVGGNGGGVWAKKDWTDATTGNSFGGHRADDWLAGAQVGCDYQVGQYVFGIQGDFDWSKASASNVNPLFVTAGGDPIGDRSSVRSLASMTARLGFAADRSLIYVRGGLAWERDRYAFFNMTTGANLQVAAETRQGWTVGVGGEYAFSNNVSAFIEYDFFDFGTERNQFATLTGGTPFLIDIKERKSVVKAGLNFRFGGAPVAAAAPLLAYKAPPMAAAYSWTGCFLGGNGGWLWAKKGWSDAASGDSYDGHTANDWLAGAQAGCDYQIGQFVFGVQGDFDWANAKGSNVNPLLVTAGGDPIGQRTDVRSLASMTARMGYAADRSLFYVRGGLAWERDQYEIYNVTTGALRETARETRPGWTVGIGGEYAFNGNLSGFIEYDFYDFGTERNNFTPAIAITPSVLDIKERKSVVKAGLNFRFGGAPVVARN